jgi:hypothetical protein
MNRFLLASGMVAGFGATLLAAAPDSDARRGTRSEPCQQITTACVDAGYKVGMATPKGKRLVKDCVHPLMDGKTVRGVTLDPQAVETCRARGRQAN